MSAAGFAAILEPHAGYMVAAGYYRCACLHTYEPAIWHGEGADRAPDPEQAEIIAARHAQHLAEVLLAAGAELPAQDPRQRLRERATRRDPRVLRDGSLLLPP